MNPPRFGQGDRVDIVLQGKIRVGTVIAYDVVADIYFIEHDGRYYRCTPNEVFAVGTLTPPMGVPIPLPSSTDCTCASLALAAFGCPSAKGGPCARRGAL